MALKRILLIGALSLCALSGCAPLDTFFGVDESGTDKPGTAPSETVSAIGGGFLPWLPAVIGMLGGGYAEIRKRKYAKALTSTVSGLEDIFDSNKDGSISIEELKAALAMAHAKAGIQPFISSLIQKL